MQMQVLCCLDSCIISVLRGCVLFYFRCEISPGGPCAWQILNYLSLLVNSAKNLNPSFCSLSLSSYFFFWLCQREIVAFWRRHCIILLFYFIFPNASCLSSILIFWKNAATPVSIKMTKLPINTNIVNVLLWDISSAPGGPLVVLGPQAGALSLVLPVGS